MPGLEPSSPSSNPPPSGAALRARCRIRSGLEAFDVYDGFIRSLHFLTEREACALIVAGDEVLDNLRTHGEIGREGVIVLVRKRPVGLTLAFFVESHQAFAAFAESLEREGVAPPRFDALEGRWRGLGLSMCRNLARSLCYRPGAFIDRIFLRF